MTEKEIFKNGSKTYFWSSRFFPASVRDDVYRLYSFVRVVDDYVDVQPQDVENFSTVAQMWESARAGLNRGKLPARGESLNERVVYNIAYVSQAYDFDLNWVDSFIASMQQDVDAARYDTLQDSLNYVYGSAEVIGLMMTQILLHNTSESDLNVSKEEIFEYARMQGRAMQWINFIRDIDEDNQLGRVYFPRSALRKFGLANISSETAAQSPAAFDSFIQSEIERYKQWQNKASKGWPYLPRRVRIPVMTAANMYGWTAEQIAQNPRIVFAKKVKPSKWRILAEVMKHALIR